MATKTAFNLVKLSTVEDKAKNLIYGFMRESRALFASNNVYYNIPMLIQQICLTYYYIRMVFNQKQHGSDIVFVNDTTIKRTTDEYWASALIGHEITDKICNNFKIDFLWKSSPHSNGQFFMGFLLSPNVDNAQLNNPLRNIGSNVAVFVHKGSKQLQVYDKMIQKYGSLTTNFQSGVQFKVGDIFSIKIDFEQNKYSVYHNHIIGLTSSMNNCKSVICGLSLGYKGEEVQIKNCTFN